MISIDITENFGDHLNIDLIEHTAKTTLHHTSNPEDTELTIVITTDERIQALNRQYRLVDAPTDVLSFPVDFFDPENEAPYIGDIIISHQRAENQARVMKHDSMAEIQLLIVHGILHLLGYDHAISSERSVMWTIQEEILQLLKLENLDVSGGG